MTMDSILSIAPKSLLSLLTSVALKILFVIVFDLLVLPYTCNWLVLHCLAIIFAWIQRRSERAMYRDTSDHESERVATDRFHFTTFALFFPFSSTLPRKSTGLFSSLLHHSLKDNLEERITARASESSFILNLILSQLKVASQPKSLARYISSGTLGYTRARFDATRNRPG